MDSDHVGAARPRYMYPGTAGQKDPRASIRAVGKRVCTMPVDQFTPYIPKGSAAASDQENDSWSKNELIIASEEGNFKKVMKLLQDNPNLEAKDSQ
eukprot:1271551-Rhodomonas_salina.1